MSVALPTPDQLRAVAEYCGLALTDEDVTSFRGLMQGSVDAYNAVAAMPDEVPVVKYPRTPGYRPGPEENPRNAWYRKATVKGAARGKLKGKVVALKDNIMLAGVPMMNGSSTLEGYVPDFDATIVTRMLDAGAEIAGKVHCESFCMSGGSHTNSTGPVHNPHKMGYSAGGSSSGSAVVVALGEVDMAIGGDQGGSIRIPSSFSGTYGMKPTWGLVPYTGIMPIEIIRRSHRADDRKRRRQRVAARGAGGRRRLRSEDQVTEGAGLYQGARWRRQGPEDRYRQGRFRTSWRRSSRERERQEGGEAARQSRGQRRRGLHSDAHASAGNLDADRNRRHDPDHDVRRRLWSQPLGSLFDVADGFSSRLARAGEFDCPRPPK